MQYRLVYKIFFRLEVKELVGVMKRPQNWPSFLIIIWFWKWGHKHGSFSYSSKCNKWWSNLIWCCVWFSFLMYLILFGIEIDVSNVHDKGFAKWCDFCCSSHCLVFSICNINPLKVLNYNTRWQKKKINRNIFHYFFLVNLSRRLLPLFHVLNASF